MSIHTTISVQSFVVFMRSEVDMAVGICIAPEKLMTGRPQSSSV
jgi:hypothetical protein